MEAAEQMEREYRSKSFLGGGGDTENRREEGQGLRSGF